nr:MAG TPA: hypothetical protein [Caudoviricetes sp.]
MCYTIHRGFDPIRATQKPDFYFLSPAFYFVKSSILASLSLTG